MKNVFKIEILKTLGYPIFWAILLLHAFFYILVVILGANIDINIQGVHIFRLFSSTYMWGTMAWIASWFNLLLAIMTIVLTSNELLYNTFRRQLLDGLNRNQLVLGKLMLVACLSIYVILLVTISGIIVGSTNSDPWGGQYLHGYRFVLVLGVQSLAYMSLAMLFGLIFRNTALSIVMYLLYFIIIEPFVRLFFSSSIDSFFPMKIISNLTPMPDFMGMLASDLSNIQAVDPNTLAQLQSVPDGISTNIAVPVCIAYTLLFLFSSSVLLKSRDL